MSNINIEHVNITVSNPDTTAQLLCKIFDWEIRWSGKSRDNGYTVHVGSDLSYLALYTYSKLSSKPANYKMVSNLNHVGILVSNLDEIEQKVLKQGLKTFNHDNYEPGKRFYFNIEDYIEIEVISYS